MKRSYDNRFWRDDGPRHFRPRPSGFRGKYPSQRPRGAYNTYQRNNYQWSNGPKPLLGPMMRPPQQVFHQDVRMEGRQYRPNRREYTNFETESPYKAPYHRIPSPTLSQETGHLNRPYYLDEIQVRRNSLEDTRYHQTEHHDQALYDTVDIVKQKLSDRKKRSEYSVNNNSDTYVLSVHDQAKSIRNSSHSEPAENSNRIFTRRPNQSISKLVRERVTTRENCENMKTKIVQQLLKMDRNALQKLIANPRPSSKFECVIHSLLPEYRDSLNRDLRNKAEKSLMHEVDDHAVKSEDIYEDTFMNQMRGLLDPEDTVIISDIKPILMAQLKKKLETDDLDDKHVGLSIINPNIESHSNDHYPSRDVLSCENYNTVEAPTEHSVEELSEGEEKFDDIGRLENFEPDSVVDSILNEQESHIGVTPVDDPNRKIQPASEKDLSPPFSFADDEFEDCGQFQFNEEDTRIDRRHTIFNKSININEYLRRSTSKEYDNFDDNFTATTRYSNVKKEQISKPSDNPLSDSLADFIIENSDHVCIKAKPVFFNEKRTSSHADELRNPVDDPVNSKNLSGVCNFVAHKEITQMEQGHKAATNQVTKNKKNTINKAKKTKGEALKDNKVDTESTRKNKKSNTCLTTKKVQPNKKQSAKKKQTVQSSLTGLLIPQTVSSKKKGKNSANYPCDKSVKAVASKEKSMVNHTLTKSPSKNLLTENLSKLVTIDMFQKIPKSKSEGLTNSNPRVRDKTKAGQQLQAIEVPVKDTLDHLEKKCKCSHIPDTKSQHCQTDNNEDLCILCELVHREKNKHNPSSKDEIIDWIKMIDKAIPKLMQKKLALFNKLPQSERTKASEMGEFGMTLVNIKRPNPLRVEKKASTDKPLPLTDTPLKLQQKNPPRTYGRNKKHVESHISTPTKKLQTPKKLNKNNIKNLKRIFSNSSANQKDILTKPCFVKLIKLDASAIEKLKHKSKSVITVEPDVQPTVKVVEVNSNDVCKDIGVTSKFLTDICNDATDLCGIVDLNEIVDMENFTDLSACVLSLDVQGDTIIADVDIEAIAEEVVGDIHDMCIEEPCNQGTEEVVKAAEIMMYDYTSEDLASDCITVAGHTDGILAIEVVNNNFLASSVDGNIYYFNGADGHMIRTLRGYNLPVTCMIVVEGADKTTVYSGSLDSRIRSYNLEAGIECSPECNVLSPILTMDKAWDTLFVGTTTGFVLQFECKNNTLIPVSSMKFSDQNIMCLRAVVGGARRVLLVGARSGHVCVQDAQTGMLLRTLEGPKATVYTLLCEANKVICATNSPQMQIYDFTSGVHMGVHNTLRGCTCMRSAGGLLFAGGLDGCVYVFRGQAEPLAQLRGPAILLTSLAIIDCRVIAAYKDRSLFIWKLSPSVLQEMIL